MVYLFKIDHLYHGYVKLPNAIDENLRSPTTNDLDETINDLI